MITYVKHLLHIKRFSNKIVFKFSKNVELKIVNDPEIGWYVKIENNWDRVKNAEFKFAN